MATEKMTSSITLTAMVVLLLLCYSCISYLELLYNDNRNILIAQGGGGSSFAVVTAFSTSSYPTCTHHSTTSSPLHQLNYNHHRIGNGIHSATFTTSSSPSRRSSTKLSSTSSTSTTTESSSSSISKIELQKLTIKQLKSYITDNSIIIPKGMSSTLKLKKDIVNFIWDSISSSGGLNGSELNGGEIDKVDVNGDLNGQEADAGVTTDSAEEQSTSTTKKKKRSAMMGTRMPPLPSSDEEEQDQSNNKDDTPYILTPKDRIVLDVLHRYPPLHDSIINACTDPDSDHLPLKGITTSNIEHCNLNALNYEIPMGIGEHDIRHSYHPMICNISQSDLDIVFVGTASCTPGVTRGVSCTALRLNWRSHKWTSDSETKGGGTKRQKKDSKTQHVDERGSPTGGTWLFDCGESTQLSIQRTSSIKPGKISKIFITHCHGDHSFGLPGLLCLMGTDRSRNDPPIDIYGPEGLRMWLRVAVRYSVSRVVPCYRVHELLDVPMAPEWELGHRNNGRFYYQLKRGRDGNMREKYGNGNNNGGGGSGSRRRRQWKMQGLAGEDPVSWISRAPMINLEPSKDFGEIEGGRDIYPQYDHPQSNDGAPVWIVEEDDDVTVTAAPMSHGVPCVGYVIQEHDRPGRLKPENVLPVIERNREGLIESGVRNPMKVMAMVKNLDVGSSYTFPDGTILRQEDVVEPPRSGRKVVICGDTADCRALEGLAQNADVVVHEATNTFLPGVDKDGSTKLVTRDAKIHGHSTPFMAGEFAKRINAKKLVMNHFSARYKGDQSVESMTIMTRMERQAIKASGLSEESVAAAWDYMVLPIPRNE